MVKNPIPLLIGLLASVLFLGQWFYAKKANCCDISAAVSISSIAAPTASQNAAIVINDAAAFNAQYGDNLRFKQSTFNYATPISAPLTGVFKQTASYLKAHPDRSLKVTGYYTEGEKNGSTFPTLGLARANSIKMMLTGFGASASQIEMDDFKTADLTFRNDTLIGGASYVFSGLVKNDVRLADIEKRIKAKPLVVYFGTNQSNLELSAQQKQDFSDLQYYLEHKEGVKSKVTGHTDNVGNLDKNIALSKSRAEFVRAYMVKVGFPVVKINTDGKGPNVPITSNDNDEGRSKNRRVEIGIE